MYAIISDIHSNVEALTAVMDDIASQGVDEILCLGDVVGYGPDPEECIDMIEEKCRFCLSGNHDYAVLTRAERFNPLAEEAVDFTRRRLRPKWYSFGRLRARWSFLEGIFEQKREQDVLYVHGSPRDSRNEYILETDITFGNVEKIEEIFALVPRLCFVGHTHVPGIITEEFEFKAPSDFGGEIELDPDEKYIINVSAVGQPRDGDNRACYAIVDGNKIAYRRVEYDFRKTMEKMEVVGPISREAAERLEQGR